MKMPISLLGMGMVIRKMTRGLFTMTNRRAGYFWLRLNVSSIECASATWSRWMPGIAGCRS